MSPYVHSFHGRLSGLRGLLRLSIFSCVLLALACQVQAGETIQSFTLQDNLRFDWKNQFVTFPLDAAAAAQLGKNGNDQLRLLGPAGQPVAFQRFEKEGKPTIAFFADVPSLADVTYKLVKADSGMAATPKSLVTIKESADEIRMFNQNTGVAVAQTVEGSKTGPIRQLYMADGQWVGRSMMPDDLTVSGFKAYVSDNGPVFAQIICTYQFAQGGSWTLQFRLPSQGKAVIIEEQLNDVTSKGNWIFRFNAQEAPTHMLNRVGYDGSNKLATKDALVASDIKTDQGKHGWRLNPWHSWWNRFDGVAFHMLRLPQGKVLANYNNPQRRTNDWFIVDDGQKPELSWKESDEHKTLDQPVVSLLLGAGIASQWAKDGQRGLNHIIRLIHLKENEFEFRMPLGEWPGRRWFIGSDMSKQAYFDNGDLIGAHAMVVDYYDRPLDRVKDLVLSWKPKSDKPSSYIFPSQDELVPMRERGLTIGTGLNARRRSIKKYILDPKNNMSVRKDFEANMLPPLREFGGFILQADPTIGVGRNAGINSALHHIGIRTENAAFMADAAFGHFDISDEDRRVLRARLALTAYSIAGGDMVNGPKGFANHANMTATMYGGLGLVACVLPGHPEAAHWAKLTADTNLKFLEYWSGPNGSWTEAPHYQLVTMNSMLVFGLAAKRAGISDFVYDPRLKKTVSYLANISTPPDPSFHNFRHLPPIGNTYLKEQSNIFAVMAGLYQDRDPEYAAHMQWMWEQQGKPSIMLIGGDATIDWFVDFTYGDVKPIKPDWGSVYYPYFGAVLRHAYGTDHETYMVNHHGRFLGHYDNDQGSFEMWGKGQPLMLDWGYNGAMPAWLHNTASFTGGGSIENFDSQPWSDLSEAKQKSWSRRMLFAKDPTVDGKTDGPAYYVIQDRAEDLSSARKPTALWYWFNTTQTPTKQGQIIRVVGPGDVNLDVWVDQAAADSLPMYTANEWAAYLAKDKANDKDGVSTEGTAAGDAVKTKLHTVKAYGGTNGSWKMSSTTQHGLSIPFNSNQTITTVLFPRSVNDKPPVITSLENGRCLRVVTSVGTDYLFFGDEPMDVTVDGVNFQGRVGVAQIRKDATYLTLHDGQSISSKNAVLKQSQGKSLRVAR